MRFSLSPGIMRLTMRFSQSPGIMKLTKRLGPFPRNNEEMALSTGITTLTLNN